MGSLLYMELAANVNLQTWSTESNSNSCAKPRSLAKHWFVAIIVSITWGDLVRHRDNGVEK